MSEPTSQPASRRDFLKTSAAVAGATLASGLVVPAGPRRRQRRAAGSAWSAAAAAAPAPPCRPSAPTRTPASSPWAMPSPTASRSACKPPRRDRGHRRAHRGRSADHRFTGFDAYKSVIENVDVVLLATPPGFRPIHLQAAIDAGKHVFCEKPMAVDGPGVRKVLDAAAEAKKKNLSLVSGFCWRRHPIMRETMKRVHDGALGDILDDAVQLQHRPLWVRKREPGWSDMEYQMRNWYYYAWLSGDFNVEQHIHSLDKAAWAMKDVYPVQGGRPRRAAGADRAGVRPHLRPSRRRLRIRERHAAIQLLPPAGRLRHRRLRPLLGHAGHLRRDRHVPAARRRSAGKEAWKSNRKDDGDMYQIEHNELFASIRAGKPINDGEWMARSTLMGIMGRMATYTGQVITWEQALNSKEDLSPPAYDMKASLPEPKVALPGVTKFV